MISGSDRRGAHVRMCARPPLILTLPSTRTTALALFRLLNLIPLQRRPIWITPTGRHLHDYINNYFFCPLCLVTTFGVIDEFEDVSDDDVALLVPIGESEHGA